MKALKINVNFQTGARAGGVNPRKYRGHPQWQNTDEGWEIRIIPDEDAAKFAGVDGVELLDGEDAINVAVDTIPQSTRPTLTKELQTALTIEHIKKKNIDLDELAKLTPEDMAEVLINQGVIGIYHRESRRPKAHELLSVPGVGGKQ